MTSSEWIEIATKLAWPVVGLLTLLYVWRSDAIGKLIKISDAVQDLRERLKELVEAEERLNHSVGAISEVTATINQLQSDFLLMKADVENIRDRVDQPIDHFQHDEPIAHGNNAELNERFSQIDSAWQSLSEALQEKFGWFDGRKTGSEAYRFAHGNRKGAKLTYEQADEIARLHSSIKSYRRRHASLGDWLTAETRDEFVAACAAIGDKIRSL